MITAPAAQSTTNTVRPQTDSMPSFKVKWISTDLDGTFFDAHHAVTQKTIDTYRRLHNNGVRVIPNTGRTVYGVKALLEEKAPEFAAKDFKYFPGIYGNGAVVYGDSEDQILFENVIDTEALREFYAACYEWADKRNAAGIPTPMVIMAQNRHTGYVDYANDFWLAYKAKWAEETCEPVNMRWTDPNCKLGEYNFFVTSAIVTYETLPELFQFLCSHPVLKEKVQGKAKLLCPGPPMVSAFSSQGGKALALKQLMSKYPELTPSSYIAIGDGENDVDMLTEAPFAVAMGQAVDKIKKCAQAETTSNDNEGWANAMEKFVESTSCSK